MAEEGRQDLEALMDGMERVVAGSLKVKAQGDMSEIPPDMALAEMRRKLAKPGLAKM